MAWVEETRPPLSPSPSSEIHTCPHSPSTPFPPFPLSSLLSLSRSSEPTTALSPHPPTYPTGGLRPQCRGRAVPDVLRNAALPPLLHTAPTTSQVHTSSHIITHHQTSSDFIRHHHQTSSDIIIRHHQTSSDFIRLHQTSSSDIIRYHQASSDITTTTKSEANHTVLFLSYSCACIPPSLRPRTVWDSTKDAARDGDATRARQ